MIKNKDYDLVLMDLQMPELDGYEARRSVKLLQDEKYRSLPVIALSAAAFAEEQDKVYEYGMNDFVTKPFKPQDLFEKLCLYGLRVELPSEE
jgi:CheY-like chemotaxis protein